MHSHSTQTWGYKIVSPNQINFYHILMPKINLAALPKKIPSIQYIKHQKDGSVTISLDNTTSAITTVDQIVEFFTHTEKNYLDTPVFRYKIDPKLALSLKEWALSFQGCLALLMVKDQDIAKLVDKNWQFINSGVGGLVLSPFTIFFYADRAKIIHPTHVGNYEERKRIEQTLAILIRKAIRRIREAQSGQEGLALLSFVEEKTQLSQKEIAEIINEKSFGVITPNHSPFFNQNL